jgi:serine/threonine protein kinase/formylglycine-generating enzyme required for sulfatase activity
MSQPEKFEHYQLLKNEDGSSMELGRGAMGITYKAFDTNLRCDVALKVISAAYLTDPTAAERFLREARGAARLRHRNVASVFHLGRSGDTYFYSMEFIEGETLDALVKREGSVDLIVALDIAAQVASALMAAAKQNLVHRDIKPSNLMLAREDDGETIVKVIDFGLVKSALLGSTAGALTSTGFVGTPYFASPEQLDQRNEDIRSDIYSLGVTLWFMLTGRPTFLGSVASVIAQHMEKVPSFESLAVLPAHVVAVLKRMLEKDLTLRYQNPGEVRADLKKCIETIRNSESSARAIPLASMAENFETVALSGTHGLTETPSVGVVLGERYRLIEDLNTANPNHTFHAEDVMQKRRVRLKIVRGDPAALVRVQRDAEVVKHSGMPNFIEVLSVTRSGSVGFVVLEWIEGFSLLELLRVRRELTPRETLTILEQIAPVTDKARDLGLLVELQLRDVLVHFPEGLGQSDQAVILRCPMAEWPAFIVKLNPLGCIREVESAEGEEAERTMVAAPQRDPGGNIVQFGGLAHDLLGGKQGRFTPLANLSESGNAVLRRCLTSAETFPTARDFVAELRRSTGVEAPKRQAALPGQPVSVERSAGHPAKSIGGPLAPPASEPSKPAPPKSVAPMMPLIAGGIGILALIALGAIWMFIGRNSGSPTRPTSAPVAAPGSAKAVVHRDPPQKGVAWKNSLDMGYVPLGDIYFGAFKTRVSDFKAFVDSESYEAIGGMQTHQKDGFKDHGNNSWDKPGFHQGLDEPVVGVSYNDAKHFCDWLTTKERREGALRANQMYRLPTDREWSQAVGLPAESGATPEERSGKIKEVYPWGDFWPPKSDSRNYAGAESKPGNPKDWPVIPNFSDKFQRTSPALAFPPNPSGIYDLGGNAWEWCQDEFNKGPFKWHALRGGSWATSKQEEMLSSFRLSLDPSFRQDDVGFRCVIAPDSGDR